MSLQIGILGLPNVGKSTLFKAITKKQVPAENFPFCTIDPNVGVVAVPDERLNKLAALSHSEKVVPTTIEFVDIAGLVKGASQGEGLGNKFLSHIREVDALIQVVREFKDPNVIHVHGKVDAKTDKEVIDLELIMADLQQIEKRLPKVHADAKSRKPEAILELALLEQLKTLLDSGKMLSSREFTEEELVMIKPMNFLTLKPQLVVYNIDEGAVNNFSGAGIGICAKLESELAELSPEDARVMMQELGIQESGLDRLIKVSYQLLNLISFLTTGEKETRAWTITKGMKAPQAAGVIHTDFEQKFIRAEVVNWQDLLNCGSWSKARDKGLLRMEGKEYVFQDGDVTEFHHS